MEDASPPCSSRRNARNGAPSFIPPSPSVTTEVSPGFRVPPPPSNHRFGFLLPDIKPIETERAARKMRYDLPNVKQMHSSIKVGRPVMVVSLSNTDLDSARHANPDDDAAVSISTDGPTEAELVEKD
jgi:hypothetical protein